MSSRNERRRREREERAQARAESRRAQRVIQARQARRKRLLTILGSIVGGAVLIVLLVILFTREDEGSEADAPVVSAPPPAIEVETEGRFKGDPNAPVTVVEFGDFQCPGCGQFARVVEPQLVRDFVSTGQVYFEFRHYAFLGPESREAAEASWCADDQGLFWEMHDALFYNQSRENQGAFSRGRLNRIAETVAGLDMEAWSQCMDDNVHEDDVVEMSRQAQQNGVQGTPSFLVNGQLMFGPSYEELSQRIQEALAES